MWYKYIKRKSSGSYNRRRKNTKYFLSLEKKNYLNKVVSSFDVNAKFISNPKELITAKHDYFLDLYTEMTDSPDESYIESLNSFIHQPNTPKLSE